MATTTAEIRRHNAFSIIRSIHAAGDVSRRDLSGSTDLSFPAVSAICQDLLGGSLIVEVSRERSEVGRPSGRLSLNPDLGFLIGVDIAETYVLAVSFDTSLSKVSETLRPMDTHSRRPDDVIQATKDVVLAEISRHLQSRLLGVGVSAPGIVDSVGGTSVFAPNWGWRDVPLLKLLAESISCPIRLDNPLKALAIAEIWNHPSRIEQTFAVVNLGTGVGAGLAIEGQVFRGRTNSAGEWGHTVIVADGRECRCGSRGCVEAYVGAPGILETLRETHPTSELLCGDNQVTTIGNLAAAIATKDQVAMDVLERTAHFLGIALATLVNVINPDAVIVTGWVASQLGQPLVDAARPHLHSHALAVPMDASSLEFYPSTDNAVALGMAASALENYLEANAKPGMAVKDKNW